MFLYIFLKGKFSQIFFYFLHGIRANMIQNEEDTSSFHGEAEQRDNGIDVSKLI